jgi:hypothetical protein
MDEKTIETKLENEFVRHEHDDNIPYAMLI